MTFSLFVTSGLRGDYERWSESGGPVDDFGGSGLTGGLVSAMIA